MEFSLILLAPFDLKASGLVDIDHVYVSCQRKKAASGCHIRDTPSLTIAVLIEVRGRTTNVSLLTEEFQQMERKRNKFVERTSERTKWKRQIEF